MTATDKSLPTLADTPISDYDFLDLGASKGGSLKFAKQHLGGTKGLGVDIDPAKVALTRKEGWDCVQGDATTLDLPDDAVRFIVMSHFLEHLPGHQLVRLVMRSSARVARDFLYIQGPFFDADDYLESWGLKLYWSDWSGHPCPLKTHTLKRILLEEGLEDVHFFTRAPVVDSADSAIHPISARKNQHGYDPEKHPPKPAPPITFTRPIFREMVCIVRLRDFPEWDQVSGARKGLVPYDAAESAPAP